MKRILLILMTGLLAPAGLYAQKVYKEGSAVILDMSVAAGMPEGATTRDSKTYKYASFSPSNTVLRTIDGVNNDHNHPLNKKVFEKLEIALKDMNTTGNMDGSGPLTMNWETAFNGCKNSNYDSGGWRLPTQRELQMMWIFKPALEALGVTTFSTATYYWSSTENTTALSWPVHFSDGLTFNYANKNNTYRVRCVREITD